ncbi:hypothetical protein [Desulforegula conservatrix]|uniref:hypothetical protein n=1 Tax=Desulforegula conservatrix TaxID=153026 RepID=UPI000426BA92|nr:hypothetical protein [Desulforegula conservatrix]
MPDENPNENKSERAADSGIHDGANPAADTRSKKQKEPAFAGVSEIIDIEALAEEAGLADWEKAAFFRAAEWAGGKQVSREDFMAALDRFKARRMGGGRI